MTMENKKPQLNQKLLTPEQRDQLEVYQQAQKQLQTLQDIADIAQETLSVLDDQKNEGGKTAKEMGALFTDMRESLVALKDKEAPESPDYSKPVVDAVKKLETALTASIKAIDIKPVIDAPQVNVSPPSVDLEGVEKALSAMPKAFEQAISKIVIPEAPETDNQPLLDAWEGISEQLVSIETATRMKPQFPNTLKVTNPDGSNIGDGVLQMDNPQAQKITVSGSVTYIAVATPGSDQASAVWQAKKIDESVAGTTTITWADGDALYDNIATNLTALAYA